MNKKLITLCVSALLAGGMVTPAFASLRSETNPVAYEQYATWEKLSPYFYYEIKLHSESGNVNFINSKVDYSDYSLKATWDYVGLSDDQDEISGYTLWKFNPVKDANGNLLGYNIVNAYGIPLAIKETKDASGISSYSLDDEGSITIFRKEFTATSNDANFQMVAPIDNGSKLYLYYDNGKISVTKDAAALTNNNRLSFTIYEPSSFANDADALESVFGDHFGLQIGYYEKGEYKQYENLLGNVFTGKLYPANNDNLDSSTSGLIYQIPANSKETFLMNEAGEFIVLLKDKWNQVNTNLNGVSNVGYRFDTMTAKELGEDLAKGANSTVLSYVFRISGINGHIKDIDAPIEVAVKINMTVPEDEDTWAELLVAGINKAGTKEYYLTTSQAAEGTATDLYDPINAANKLDLNIADYIESTYVKFGMNNYVSPTVFWGAAWNIERQDNKTPNPLSGEWVDKREVGYTVPEGQWILREVNRVQAWVNRETGENLNAADKFVFDGLRTTEEANVYTDGTYTYKITKAVDLADADRFNYFGYDAKETSTGVEETYKVMFNSQLTGEPIYISMDGVGELHLTNDPTKALEFHVDTMKTKDDAAVVNDLGRNANAEIFDIFNTYMGKDEDGNWVEKEDTVSFYRYNLSHNGKYLHYDATNNKFVLNEPTYCNGAYNANDGYIADKADEQGVYHLDYTRADHEIDAFIIKEKGGDLINILNTDNHDYEYFFHYAGSDNYIEDFVIKNDKNEVVGIDASALLADNVTKMMYFDFNFDEARQQSNIYNWVANAQLQLDYQDYNIYRNVAPTAPDTMAIYRTEYQDEFLFEKNDFLGMTVDQRGYNAALFIDTAYVRNNTEKPLFMIGLRPEITPETVYCPIHGVNAGCAHEHLDTIPGYVDADYLTVLADSAAFHAAELKNEFLANSAYTKLAFIQARHNVDTITVADDNHKTTIVEGVQHPMVFAFRIVNQETQDFIIEGVDLADNKAEFDAQKNPYVTSWVRWNNGVPVMTDRMEDAEVFNIAGDIESAPTANEAIEAEATVTVVATDGAVIVKGAEGKNVIVSTILGKVVANETVNSDNETIAAPAGIVVVSVDGESFKVAVK